MLQLISFKNIGFTFGVALLLKSAFMSLLIPISWYYHETIIQQLAYAFLITGATGLILFLLCYSEQGKTFHTKESFIIISLLWIVIPLFGTLPYLFTHAIPNFYNALFESVSGFTTTGSSILTDIESLPKSVLMWRSITHWLGGIGIVVLIIAILRRLKMGGFTINDG